MLRPLKGRWKGFDKVSIVYQKGKMQVMYSPKIEEEFIPILYKLAKARGISMVKLVNEMIRKGIESQMVRNQEKGNESSSMD